MSSPAHATIHDKDDQQHGEFDLDGSLSLDSAPQFPDSISTETPQNNENKNNNSKNPSDEELVPFGDGMLCARCYAMTGSPEGIRSLLDGRATPFRADQAPKGCLCCEFCTDVVELHQRIDSNYIPRFSLGQACEGSMLNGLSLHLLELEEVYDKLFKGYIRPVYAPLCVRAARELPELPRRILDVNSGVRLYEPDEHTRAEYVALSYCWGPNKQSLLTAKKNRLDHIVNGISHDKLPRTIADAIKVCRSLGIRYLWVDSLCIVQDDEFEKQVEIAKMADIYHNTTFAMIAACAEEVEVGFLQFYDRAKRSEYPRSIELPLYINKITSGSIELRENHNPLDWSHHEPLFSRAWAMQELLLLSRALVFCSQEVLFKCQKPDQTLTPILNTGTNFKVVKNIPAAFSSEEEDIL
ncbi:heterokaryon incompatibility protein-domain-containing protein [Podospora fimiseda]|uniref:Heterokaryon incompatibility protein-domain-containing protein n=1 Tax=Podospora fimiseda TaxID=252190 RepID=A0AAN6YMD9_9PEZI|nr:heterokaryon incompatibility protein-domain-containing protein [Podospora fimiseda]